MGISLPSATGQEAVIRKAYSKAGIDDFSQTGYIECHGTGTPVGDPIEVEGVSRVFKRDVDKGPVLIGSASLYPYSLKTNYQLRSANDPAGENKSGTQRGR